MLSKDYLQMYNHTKISSPCHHMKWNLQQPTKPSPSFNDHSTVHTDASQTSSTLPEVSDQDSLDLSEEQKICRDFQQGYCSKGYNCNDLHVETHHKTTLMHILIQYPEQIIWSSHRMRSFLH